MTTAGSSLFPFDPSLNNVGCTPHARCDTERVGRTIHGAGTALHTTIQVDDRRFVRIELKHAMGTYDLTYSTAHTGRNIEFKG